MDAPAQRKEEKKERRGKNQDVLPSFKHTVLYSASTNPACGITYGICMCTGTVP